MSLTEVISCLELIHTKVQKHRNILLNNESMTKSVLVEPLFIALGWTMPENLRKEVRTGANKSMDYGLYIDNRHVVAIEAKAFGRRLTNDDVFQASAYANQS